MKMNWIFENIIDMITNIIQAVLDFLGDFINGAFAGVARLNTDLPAVITARNFVISFSLTFIVLFALKMFFTIYVLETDGDSDMDPINMLVRLTEAIAIICCNTWIFNLFMSFSDAFCSDLVGISKTSVSDSIVKLLLEIKSGPQMTFAIAGFVLFLLALLIGLIVFIIIAGKRGAELSLMSILLPLFAIDLLTTSRERWNAFLTTYIVTFFSYSLQMLCFKIFCSTLTRVTLGGMTLEIVALFGWFFLMLSSPKWLEKFCYTSGLRSAVGNTARTAPYMLMQIARRK